MPRLSPGRSRPRRARREAAESRAHERRPREGIKAAGAPRQERCARGAREVLGARERHQSIAGWLRRFRDPWAHRGMAREVPRSSRPIRRWRMRVPMASFRCHLDRGERVRKFLREQVRRSRTICSPPRIDSLNLRLGLRRDDQPARHRLRRAARPSLARRPCPDWTADHAFEIAMFSRAAAQHATTRQREP